MDSVEMQVLQLLTSGENVVLATVLRTECSTPRAVGARMIVRAGGTIGGTIGGGSIEAVVVATSQKLFQSRDAVIQTFDLDSQGMICGGRMTMLMEYLPASPENVTRFQDILSVIQDQTRGLVVASLGDAIEGRRPPLSRVLIDAAGQSPASGAPSAAAVEQWLQSPRAQRCPMVITDNGQWFLLEPRYSWGTVYLFGAGHVGLSTATLAKMTGFQTVVVDDRSEYANRERFATADEVRVVGSFEKALDGLPLDVDSYVVIVTRGHRHDQTVLAQALRTRARYVGMISSRKKRDTVFNALRQEGYTEDEIRRVHSPIGIAIHADTPEEIAVSIVAELIRERNRPSAKRC